MIESTVAERRLAYALDASALLAYLFHEPGAEFVRQVLPHSLISAVNWAEVLQRLMAGGHDPTGLEEDLVFLGLELVPFSARDAAAAAALFLATRSREGSPSATAPAWPSPAAAT